MLEKFLNERRIKKGVEIEDSIMTVTQKEEAVIEKPFQRKGLTIVWFFMLVALLLLFTRIFYLSVWKGEYYSEVSNGNRIRSIVIKAPRGEIKDRFGKILAKNIPSVDAIIVPSDLPKSFEEKKAMAGKAAEALDMNSGNLEAILASQDEKSADPVLLKENITQDQALILSEMSKEMPGIVIEKTARRFYENSNIFSSLIGYDGKITREELKNNGSYSMTDYIGKSGIEKSYEKELRGDYGAKQVEIDSLGNVKKNLGVINPEPGQDLILNIDEDLQKSLYDELSAVLEKTKTKTAAAVAIDPRNGGVLAMVSLPSYDNNMFARGITNDEYKNIISDSALPLFNRVTNGEYPPGSTLKPAIAAAALSEGTITAETTVNDASGAINVGAWRFGDWKTHGLVDVKKAIAESCDVFFYTVGGGYGNIEGLGMSRMKKYEELFGFGQATGVDIPSEATGLIPDENWKLDKIKEKWYIGDSYHASIGQGFVTATPIQLANYVAAIANGGTLYSPRIVNRIEKNGKTEEEIVSPVVRKNFISDNVLQIVREGMRQTVLSGTAQTLKDLPVEAAGKTGTAEFGSEGKTHAWFVSYAPYDNPQIAIAVLVEGGGEGNSSALPVTHNVLERYFSRDK